MTSVTDSTGDIAPSDPASEISPVSNDTLQLMRRALVVISLFTVGQDSEVDDELEELRHSIRDSIKQNAELPDGFKSRIERLEGMLNDYERQHALGTEQLISHVQKQASQMLDQLDSEDLELELRTLRRDAGIELQTWKGCRQQLTRWVDLYERLKLAIPTPVEPEPAKEPEPVAEPVGKEFLDELESVMDADEKEIEIQIDDLEDVEEAEKPDADSVSLAKTTALGLANLVRRLTVAENVMKTREELISRLESSDQDADWKLLLDEVTDIVLVSIKTNSNAVAQFFRSLEQHVGSVQSFIDSGDLLATNNRSKLVEEVQQHVTDARNRLNAWYDPAMAAEEVEGHLVHLEARLEAFNQSETEREKVLQERLDETERRLQQITDEALEAQRNLEDHLKTQMHRATHDALTGLPNRAAYQSRVKEAWAEMSVNPDEEFSLIVADVDHFKKVNAEFGHQAGDRVLKIIAAALRKTLPKKEFLSRIGGEEFVAVIRSDAQGASVIAEILRAAIEGIPCHFQGKPVPISMSFGVAAVRQGEPSHLTYDRAEQALAEAKEKGRNCVVKAQA